MRNKLADKKRFFTIGRMFPNIVTIAGLCFGLSAIRFALDGKFEMAASFLIIAGVLDGMDGRVARLLKATSNFGAHLDSLIDFASFGVAPAIVIYLWQLHNIDVPRVGWLIALFYAICMSLRLARFNSDLEDEAKPAWLDKYFKGVPAPCGASLMILPMVMEFAYAVPGFFDPLLIGVYSIIVGLLLISNIPTLSLKKLSIARENVPIFLGIVGLLFASLIIEPWITLFYIGLIYLLSIPVTYIQYKKSLKNN